MSCNIEDRVTCINSDLCNICINKSMYKEKKRAAQTKTNKDTRRKEGGQFEDHVVNMYNSVNRDGNRTDIHRGSQARNIKGSGSVWFKPGDAKTLNALFEAKLRGSKTSKGVKTISINKDWLDKARREAYEVHGVDYWFLTFGFKDSDEIYAVTDFDLIANLLQTIEELQKKEGIGNGRSCSTDAE